MSWTVYRHITPNGKSYIGITSKKPEDRWRNGEGYELHLPFRNAIEKYKWENIKHEILNTNLTEDEAKRLEKEYIEKYRTFVGFKDCKGYNCTLGGDGSTGYKHSEETKKRIGEINKGNQYCKGKHQTDEAKKKNSEAHKGKTPWNKGQTGVQVAWNKGKTGVQVAWNKGMHRVYHEDGTFHMER